MRHGRKGFLQLQDGDLRIALIAVCFGFVCRARIDLIFIYDGGPDEGGERCRHDLCGFDTLKPLKPSWSAEKRVFTASKVVLVVSDFSVSR